MVAWDGSYYVNYFHDASWRWVFPPGYPLAIAAVRAAVGDGVLAAQVVSALAGALLVIPLYYLARSVLTPKGSLVAAALAVLNPLMIRYGALAMSESLYVLLVVTAFWCYSRKSMFPFGLAAGASYLVRPEAVLFFALLVAYDAATTRRARPVLLALAGLLLVAAPYLLSLRAESGRWSLSPKSENLRAWDTDWRANVTREGTSGQPEERSFLEASVGSYPDRFLAHGSNLLIYAGIPLVGFALAGAAFHKGALLAGVAMFFALPLFGLTPYARFMIPYLPFLAILAVLALEHIPKPQALYIGGLVCLLGVAPVYGEITTPDDDMVELKEAGLALRAEARPNDLFLDRKPYAAFYAGGRYTQIPNEPPDTVLAFARRAGARFLVLGERVVYVFRPQLKPLLYASDSAAADRGLVTRYVNALHTGNGVRILEIRP
jgi:4-amino-4-deoxy-L-arabinose transferase-like glycosyltransferase